METQPNQGVPTLHGTHVSGIIAANGSLKGVAPEAELYVYRALGPGGQGTTEQVIEAIDAKEIFGAEYVNVQPHSGAQANMAVYFTILEQGDTVLGMNLSHGGHLTLKIRR